MNINLIENSNNHETNLFIPGDNKRMKANEDEIEEFATYLSPQNIYDRKIPVYFKQKNPR